MRTFSDASLRLAEYRICLERDVAAGIIPEPAFARVDACYVSISTMLEIARVELEAAGPARERAFTTRFVGGGAALARCMYKATRRPVCLEELERIAAEVSGKARALKEYLAGAGALTIAGRDPGRSAGGVRRTGGSNGPYLSPCAATPVTASSS